VAEPSNVFISWSRPRGKAAAAALHEWLPSVLQAVKPWMSDKDIDKGTVWFDELAGALGSLKLGIVCVTRESLSEPWLLYEAGVLSKALDRQTRVWTYLIGDLQKQDVPQPLGLFQATVADETDTFRLVESINEAMGDGRTISKEALKKQFEKWWPDLKAKLAAIPPPEGAPVARRSAEDMMAEVLELSREGAHINNKGIQHLIGLMQVVSTSVRNLTQHVDLLRTSQGDMGRLSDLAGATGRPSSILSQEWTEIDLAGIKERLDSLQVKLDSFKEEKK
jgi:hypothetical protein